MKNPIRYSISGFFLIMLLFSLTVTAQNAAKTYISQWKTVEDFQKKGLPKSALEEVKKIYQRAKTEKRGDQLIKAVIYMSGLQSENREANEILSIQEIEKEIATSKEPVKSILYNVLAGKYYSYYQNHRWTLYERTQTAGFKTNDIATWSLQDFHDKINSLYLLSLKNEPLLKQTLLNVYDEILVKGNTRILRPTLYDLLSHEALKYFSSGANHDNKPAYAFEINSAQAFDPASDFIQAKFETKDTTALEYDALKLYQKLIAFHLNDAKPDALLDVNLQRLQYVYQKSVHADKDSLYLKALDNILKHYKNAPAAAQAWYLMAVWYNEKGSQFRAEQDTSYRFAKVKAREICEKVIKENPSAEGGINAYNLLNGILRAGLEFTAENVNIPEKPFRVLVEYNNFSRLFLKIVKATSETKRSLRNRYGIDNLHLLTSAPPVRSWEQKLPDTKDHQTHRVEIKVEALPVGEYILIASTHADFSSSKTIIGARLLYISNISFIQEADNYFILHRDTRQPLVRANVRIWQTTYNRDQLSLKERGPLFTTDINGFFKRKFEIKLMNQQNELLEITHGKDRLFVQDPVYTYYNQQENTKPADAIYLFTDRSIYRPGQLIYYKGIVRKGDKVSGDRDSEIKVILYNANREIVETSVKKVNEFGSFSGQFILPGGLLNGRFSITADAKYQVSFHVEEYKRPKFSITYDTLKATYKVSDTIRVTGSAMAYAGNDINGAKVSYRVVRNPRFIYPFLYKHGWLPRTAPLEITHGETITDRAGKFTVTFPAIPDLKIDKKFDPVFDYTVYTDVTDSNGETRSSSSTVSVSYKSLILKLNIPVQLAADSLKSLAIRTENSNGSFTPSKVSVKISRLLPEQRLVRRRYWQQPDVFAMSKEAYIKDFPNDEYDQETNSENWPEQDVVLEKTDSVKLDTKFSVSEIRFAPGFYKIEVRTEDKNNAVVKDVRYITLTDPLNDELNRTQYLSLQRSQPIEPGEKTNVTLNSAADSVFVISRSSQKSIQKPSFHFISLHRQKQTFTFSAEEQDRGGYVINYAFVKHNRIHQHSEVIRVPWTNKELKIEYATFRDKTLPGSEEKWKVKITGYKKEIIAAEMLAGMYDASLDQFYQHKWITPKFPTAFSLRAWNGSRNFSSVRSQFYNNYPVDYKLFEKRYDEINDFNNRLQIMLRGASSGVQYKRDASAGNIVFDQNSLNEVVTVGYGVKKDEEVPELAVTVSQGMEEKAVLVGSIATASPPKQEPAAIRKNLNETAFFFPNLKTDKDGSIAFSFTMPEALTRWKFQALAHTRELAVGYSSKEIVTQKDLMVQPNPPRFLREGDKMVFSSKIVNLTDKPISGTVVLQLFDTETNTSVDRIFKNSISTQSFSLSAKESNPVTFPLEIPLNLNKALTWRITAQSESVSDGEENILPVLTNRTLVTETMPISMRGNGSKDFRFEKLINTSSSETLSNHSLKVEYTTNPAWYAIQALPYLMEYPYECTEQTWNRYYANSIGAHIANSTPRIAKVFETWRTADTTAMLSNLQKNPELKSALLEETPWVLSAKTEAQQKRNIALLFDMIKMADERNVSLGKLEQMQTKAGGFSWFKEGPDDRYMTQYIVTGIGHLRKIKAIQNGQEERISRLLQQAITYLDKKIKNDYDELIETNQISDKYVPDNLTIQYLYMRSFFPELNVAPGSEKAYAFFMKQIKRSWLSRSKYMQGMIALTLHRSNDKITSKAILKSLEETAVYNEETGMTWETSGGLWWHQAPVERQALLIEAFEEVGSGSKAVNDLRTWLLKNKQTTGWKSTRATAEACYALLLKGTDWLSGEAVATIRLGETSLKSGEEKQEAGTGYFSKTIEVEKITPAMGQVRLEVTNNAPALPGWGAVYWQYFEDLDKITFAETPLKIVKKLFIEKNSDKGPVLSPVDEKTIVKVGDKIKVRIELRADRDMEYVHMKDMRASALEPVNVLSGYKWQGGLGYYESTKDASTNFFFDYLRKGTYVFEYPLFVTHKGNFSNGITTVQCMYAPEFMAHSEGVRIRVE